MDNTFQPDNPLNKLINNLGIAIWELDCEYRILHYNLKAKAIYGEQVIGKFCYQVAAGRNTVCPDCPAEMVFNGRESGRSLHTRTTVDGRQITIDHIATPLRDQDEQLTGVVVSIIDITDIINTQNELEKHKNKLGKLVEERTRALQESEERYRRLYQEAKLQSSLYQSVLESSSDAIVIYDLQGLTRYINPAFTEMFGWTLEELQGRRIPFMPESEREESLKRITALINDGTPCRAFETTRHTRDGKPLEISLSASRYYDHRGEPAGILVILRDITELKKIEKEAMKVHKLESIGVLAGGIAHDFNNILGAILGNISLALTLTGNDTRISNLLKSCEKASLRARGLTQQLLTFAKGGEPIKKIASIEEIIRDSTNFVLQGSNVKCNFNFATGLWPVNVDADQISQVIQNIIINANQAMPDGGIIEIECRNHRLEASCHTLESGDYIKIDIKDKGGGIPREVLDKIFDPYFTTKSDGSGLGLTITHSIIKRHNGHIEIESTPGSGSNVTIYLPAAATEDSTSGSVPADPSPASTGKGQVLIVDDEEMIREILSQMLESKGYEVVSAPDGKSAINLYQEALEKKQPFDLVIMDLTIPGGMGGLEASKEIRKIDPGARLVVSSGYSSDPVVANFREHGFCATLNKPFQFKELIEVVNQIISPETQS
ncbi:MAG: PAS domain S-box protein [Deltaproteobacteria bacterium]|nr:PAS domain S-box protein [Deltaproteobacteria bacterium]